MTKQKKALLRAVIYIRVSSEVQAAADKVSIHAQEADCRAYCESKGYTIVDVYRDAEKYRVNGRLVEPSGTRYDRPQLRKMLADGAAGRFEVIVAWREDRLYRAMRPMLDVIECIEQNKLDIELVKETFDRNIAPVKAWAARMELQAKHDRIQMGMAGRFAKGKAWNNSAPYGYKRIDGYYEIREDEAQWVRRIWEWYGDGVGVREIRKQLIAAGAPQSERARRKDVWGLPRIRKILRYKPYYTGIQTITSNGQKFDIKLPLVVDAGTTSKVNARRASYKEYPVGNVKYDYLGLGIVYCSGCGWKMYASGRKRRKSPEGEYRCPKSYWGYPEPGCTRSIGWHKLDRMLWEKVLEFLTDDERFMKELEAKIAILRQEETDAGAACDKLRDRLEALALERQRVITWARKGQITDKDLDMQLGALAIEEEDIKHELAEKSLLIGNRAQKLISFANQYRGEFRAGLTGLETKPSTPEEAKRQFEIKRHAVEALVTRVEVQPDRTIRVTFVLDPGQMQNPQVAT